jgi:hypothetical protein
LALNALTITMNCNESALVKAKYVRLDYVRTNVLGKSELQRFTGNLICLLITQGSSYRENYLYYHNLIIQT